MTYPILVQKNDLFAERHNVLVLFNVNILSFSRLPTPQNGLLRLYRGRLVKALP